jgi:hypothetical protein
LQQDFPINVNHMSVMGAAIIDVMGNVLCMLGLQLVGSGMFQVMYSSVVCFTAVLSRTILGKQVTVGQPFLIFPDAPIFLSPHQKKKSQNTPCNAPCKTWVVQQQLTFVSAAQRLQWTGIVIVVVGLAITSLGGHAHHKKLQQEMQQDTVHILYGIGITLTGIVG